MKILGDDAPQHYVDKLNADAKPWYLRPNYDQSEILMDPDGGVRAGTPPALVERLTAHEHGGKDRSSYPTTLPDVWYRHDVQPELLDDVQVVHDR